VNRAASALGSRPITTAIAYTVVGVFPLYLTAAQSVRLQDELDFSRTQFGLVVGSFYLVSSIASKMIGPVLDRRGPDFGLRYSGVVTLASAGLAAFANGWVTLAIAMAVGGLANALGQIASNLVVATKVSFDRTGRAFAAKQAAVPVGAMLAGLAVPWVGLSTSWRVPYIVAGVAGLIMMVIAPRFDTGDRVTVDRESLKVTPALLAFMVMAAIGGGIGNSLASFVTDASVTIGFSQGAGARILTIGSIVAVAARLTVGQVADRRQRTGVSELISLLGVAVVGLGILGLAGDSMTLFVVGVLLAFAGSWGWQGVMFYSVVRLIPMPAATSTGAVAAGVYLGTMIMPPLVGLGADRYSYATVFALEAGLVLVGIAAVLLSRRLALAESPPNRSTASL
jgi:MFS family permease